jgi:hypothetical protein
MSQKGELKDKMNAAEFREYWKKQEAAKGSKFGAIRTQTADGQKFDSKLEATFYNRHRLLLQQGELLKMERQVRFEFIINGVFVTSYKVDFILHWKDGRVQHIDCKSQPTQTEAYRIRKLLMRAVYGIEITEAYE